MRCLFRGVFVLLLIAGLGLLVLLGFYAEENIRGEHEWAAAQQNLRNAGESYDFNDLIPPSVPDSQNLAAIPLFKMEIESKKGNLRQAVALKEALSNIAPSSTSWPKTGNWPKAGQTDMAPIRKYLSDRYREVFGYSDPNLGPMEEFNALCPAINQLREAAMTRKLVRFDRDYTTQPPYDRTFASIAELIYLAKVLNLHAVVALSERKPDVALNDIGLTLEISKGLAREPVLISGLVSIAMVAIQMSSIWEGLDGHAWSAQQLDELQGQLQAMDCISEFQLCVRGEAIGFFAQNNDWMRDHRRSASQVLWGPVIQLITGADDNSLEPTSRVSYGAKLVGWLVPRGWFDMSKARGVSLYYQVARETANPKAHSFDKEKLDRFKQKIQSLGWYDLPDLLLRISAPPEVNSMSQFAKGQFRADAASIACGLESYRLTKGIYPSSLSELPNSQTLPLDAIGGEPYHYKLVSDKNYILYSVGWDRKDDGGIIVHRPGFPESIDWDHGDWVWPTP
jgi:hypothetical protein